MYVNSLYDQLISRQLVGILIVIFVRKPIKSYFSEVKTCAAGAGLMGMMVSSTLSMALNPTGP